MSWVNNVDWLQLNRDLQNIEMLRLQQEQNRILKESLDRSKAAAARPSVTASRSETEFEHLQQAEIDALESLDPAAFINMGDWWYREGEYEEAMASFITAATLCYEGSQTPGFLCNRIAFAADNLQKTQITRFWFKRGADNHDTNCANSLIFSFLIEEEKWLEIDKYVAEAKANDSGPATTSAISNGAISLYKRGEIDQAVREFKAAIERPDKTANSEAFWWLSKIFSDKHESSLAENYYLLCQQAGGYSAPSWA